ncbi:MAG: hypothetical protein JO234_15875, partial [Hyphomicrobiales bacterium]|nr:hypothetical protein [Hyphomicrobiales bacterium]
RAGKRVAFLIDNPTLPDPTDCMERRVMKYWLVRALASGQETNCTVSLADHLKETADYLQMVQALKAAHPDMLVLDPTPLLCDEAHGICSISENGRFLYSYGDHVSDTAGTKIARRFIPELTADALR